MGRFIDLFRKTDDLHLSDFREMNLISKGDFDIAYSAVMGISLDAYLRKFIVFKPGVWLCKFYGRQTLSQTLKKFYSSHRKLKHS